MMIRGKDSAMSHAPSSSDLRWHAKVSLALGDSRLCLAALGCALAGAAMAQAADPPQSAPAAPKASTPVAHRSIASRQQKESTKARNHYVAAWGVDKLNVRYTASGNLIRFSYRVADAERAKALAAKTATPMLVGPRKGVVLQVPVMDKVGQLRQTATPQVGQEYWMVFSNKGNLVRQGDRVNVVIGAFHADGLMVE
jgi:hypothetical protein